MLKKKNVSYIENKKIILKNQVMFNVYQQWIWLKILLH